MEIATVQVGAFGVNCVILWEDPAKAWVVDPGADAELIASECAKRGLTPALAAFTHGHFDHVSGITGLKAKWPGMEVHISAEDAKWAFTEANAWGAEYPRTVRPEGLREDLAEGAALECGGLAAKVLSTPGHTPGGVCLHFAKEGVLLTGDTLFAGSMGRTDFPGGSERQIMASLKRLAGLPPETAVTPGHGPSTTIGREARTNPFVLRAATMP